MKIGIDARLINETGVGRYIRNLINELAALDKTNNYVIFLREKDFVEFKLPTKNFSKVKADVPWHTLREQFVMPKLFRNEKLDLVHVPYFNIPIFYRGKTIVTIHDLTILHFATGKATTLPKFLYLFRRLGYYLILAFGLRKADKIIAVSEATKKEIMHHFQIPGNNISVTYEGVDKNFGVNGNNKISPIYNSPYFLYVGNAYPHKNLEILVNAFNELKSETKLVFVGKEDFFYKRLKDLIKKIGLSKRIFFFGEANDKELGNLYLHAKALVFPSVMEGFGLPAIEALTLGCPVIASNIPVFHEILGDVPLYFESGSIPSLLKELQKIDSQKEIKHIIFNSSKYDWREMAITTLNLYKNIK